MNTFRQVINSERYERLAVRIGRPAPRIDRFWVALIAAAVVVFACFFVIGHARQPSAPSQGGEAPSSSHAASVRAEIPGSLTGGPPIEGAVQSAIALAVSRQVQVSPKPQPVSTRSDLRAPAPTQSFTTEEPRVSTDSAESSATASRRQAPARPGACQTRSTCTEQGARQAQNAVPRPFVGRRRLVRHLGIGSCAIAGVVCPPP